MMSGALIVLGGAAYIGLSLFFAFTPRLRVIVALLVGGVLAGVVATQVTRWLASASATVAGPVGRWIGQSTHSVAVAIPTVVAFVLATIVVVFLRRKGGHSAASGKGHGGGARHSRAGGLATVALVCALLLPIVAGSVGDAIRSVTG